MSSKKTKKRAIVAAKNTPEFSSDVALAKRAFDLGNYHQLKKIAKNFGLDHDENSIKQVNDLLNKTKIDPKVILVGAFTLLFLFVIGFIVLT